MIFLNYAQKITEKVYEYEGICVLYLDPDNYINGCGVLGQNIMHVGRND